MCKSLFTPPLTPPLIWEGNTDEDVAPLLCEGTRERGALLLIPLLLRGGGRGGVIILFFLLIALFTSCSTPSREELASLAAKGYYQHLIEGDYDHFLEGREFADSLPADYRSQLIDCYSQFLAQQQEARGGINEVRISRAYTDSTQQYTSVLLMLCYGDSTTEEVVVPMVERNGRWMMK